MTQPVAVLVDGDNISGKNDAAILGISKEHGDPIIVRGYLDAQRAPVTLAIRSNIGISAAFSGNRTAADFSHLQPLFAWRVVLIAIQAVSC